MRWHERYPERLRWELEQFERHGLSFALDQRRLAETGQVVLEGSIEHDGERVELCVGYPDSFPFLRPEVFAPGLALDRHQHPHEGNLCLLDRSTRSWSAANSGAWLVAVRVPHLLGLLEAGGERLREGEAPQGEPESLYFSCEQGAVVFLPEPMLSVSREQTVGLLQIATGVNEPPQKLLRGCLSKVSVRGHGAKKHTLAQLEGGLAARFSGATIDGRWGRLERPPRGTRPRDLLDALAAVEPALAKPRWQPLPGGGEVSLLGAVFEEEVRQGERQDAWLFLVSLRERGGVEQRYLARGERLTAQDMRARLPARVRLKDSTVGLMGLGSIGAPLAVELLRAQVGELRVLDFDAVEAGNSVRWILGLSAVGYHKANVLTGWATSEYPFSRVRAFAHRVGAVPVPGSDPPPGLSEAEVLDEFTDGLDLVIDATAELGVQQLLASLAEPLELPQLHVWGVEGGAGGVVASLVPGTGGCWMCLQLAIDDGTLELPPAPPEAPAQPRGCADPTFAAAGFELTPVSAQAARAAVGLLRGDGSSEVHVCFLRDADGELPAPRWVTEAVPVHDRCPCAHPVAVA